MNTSLANPCWNRGAVNGQSSLRNNALEFRTFYIQIPNTSRTTRDRKRAGFFVSFLREAQIWYNRAADESMPSTNLENVIVLSDEFFQEILAHPIPTDLEAVKLLASAPAILDLFVWLSYRCFTAKGRESIPIFSDVGLVRQIGTGGVRAS